MEFAIFEGPLKFHLHGKSAPVPDRRFGEVGLRLMNEMWQSVRAGAVSTTGINHWVYLPDGRMFVGIELLPNAEPPDGLQPLAFQLNRYLKHIHIGPYQDLPSKWKALDAQLAAIGEVADSPSLEIYGHHCEDAASLETTILISLHPKAG